MNDSFKIKEQNISDIHEIYLNDKVGVPVQTLLLVNFLVGVGFHVSFSLACLAEELILSSNSLIIDFEESLSGVRDLWNGLRRVAVIGIVDGVRLHESSRAWDLAAF